jgi:hypothetical protein
MPINPRRRPAKRGRIYNQYSDDDWELGVKLGEPVIDQRQEMRLRYSHTVALVNNNLMYISEIAEFMHLPNGDMKDGPVVHGYVGTNKHQWGELKSVLAGWEDIKPFMPEARLFTLKSPNGFVDVGFLSRVPYRQNRKSYDANIYNWMLPYADLRERMGLSWELEACSAEALHALKNPIPHVPYDQALKFIRNLKGAAVSISDNYYVGLSVGNRPIIGYKNFGPCAIIGEDGTAELPQIAHYLFEDLSQHVNCRKV